jgi:hypothetical protein
VENQLTVNLQGSFFFLLFRWDLIDIEFPFGCSYLFLAEFSGEFFGAIKSC